MESSDRIVKYTTYLAGPIEHDTAEGMTSWREKLKALIKSPDLLIYDPIVQESFKTNMEAPKHIAYTRGLKQGGVWDKFLIEMDKIWLGIIRSTSDLLEVLKQVRYRSIIDGNRERDANFWGDYEAVARSNFIIVKWKSDVQTIGTVGEIYEAMILNIPVYLILDVPKTKANSTLIYWVLRSQGEVFYNIEDCVNKIKEKYKL